MKDKQEGRVDGGGWRLLTRENTEVNTITTSRRWTDVKMNGCVFVLCTWRRFFLFCFFFLDQASSCASAFYFFQMSLRVYVGCFSVGCHICLVGTLEVMSRDVVKTATSMLFFSFFFVLYKVHFFQLPNQTRSKSQPPLCPAVLTPALKQSAVEPSVHSYYSSKYYHTKTVFFSAPSCKSSQGGLVWFK